MKKLIVINLVLLVVSMGHCAVVRECDYDKDATACQKGESWEWLRSPSFVNKFGKVGDKSGSGSNGGSALDENSGCVNKTLLNLTKSSLKTLEGINWVELISADKAWISDDCRDKVKEASCLQDQCGVLCTDYCTNVIRGCLSKLVSVQGAWKQAVSSVKAASKLILLEPSCRLDVSSWGNLREPLQSLEDSVCSVYSSDCAFPLGNASTYDKGPALWSSTSNPEFGFLSDDDVFDELDSIRDSLVQISKSLGLFWPQQDHNDLDQEPHQSDEEYYNEDGFEDDDDYSGSGHFPTDDEDLIDERYPEGSGGHSFTDHDPNNEDTIDNDISLSSNTLDNSNNDRSNNQDKSSVPKSPPNKSNSNCLRSLDILFLISTTSLAFSLQQLVN